MADYKDVFKLKKKKRKGKKPLKIQIPGITVSETGVWVKDKAPPEKVWAQLTPDGRLTPIISEVKPTNPGLTGRKLAWAQGSRPAKPRPMKGPPRILPPEIDPKHKKKPKAKKRSVKKTAGGEGGRMKIGIRTGASELSKLVKAMK